MICSAYTLTHLPMPPLPPPLDPPSAHNLSHHSHPSPFPPFPLVNLSPTHHFQSPPPLSIPFSGHPHWSNPSPSHPIGKFITLPLLPLIDSSFSHRSHWSVRHPPMAPMALIGQFIALSLLPLVNSSPSRYSRRSICRPPITPNEQLIALTSLTSVKFLALPSLP